MMAGVLSHWKVVETPARKSRKKFHSKTRTGCETCRRRHIKCDEKIPSCTRCLAARLSCSGPRVLPRWEFVTSLNRDELRALQWFRERTVKSLAGYHDLDFWSHAILRLSYSHGALQHFLIAISSLDELGRLGSRCAPFATPQSLYSFSLEQYGKAIRGVLQNSPPMSIDLIASTIFCFILEVWLGDLVNAQKHAFAALRLLQSDNVQQVDNGAQGLLTLYFRPMILRMCPHFTGCSTLLREVAQDLDLQPSPSPPANCTFETQEEARRQLDAISEFVLAEAKSAAVASSTEECLKIQLQQLRRYLDQWYYRLRQLDYRSREKGSCWSLDRCHLELRYRYFSIGLIAISLQDEMLFDNFNYDFNALIDASESILKHDSKANPGGGTRSNDPSTMMALFFTVSSCRHPCIRKRALRLLYRYKRVDLIYNSLAVGILAEQIVMLEEGGSEIKTSSDVEAARRVRVVNLKYDSGFLAKATPPKMIINFEHPHANRPGVQQLCLNFVKQWTGKEFVWSACSAQTPILMEEIAPYKTDRAGFEPEQRAVDFILPVNHDLDSFWRMRIMDLSFDEEYVQKFPGRCAAYRPLSAAISET